MWKIIAVLLALVLAVVGTPAAQAGEVDSSISFTPTCNTETGAYDVTFQIVNADAGSADIVVQTYEVDGVAADAPVFDPNPVPGGTGSLASDTVPGSTTHLEIQVDLVSADANVPVSAGSTVPGDCTVAPSDASPPAAIAPDVPAACSFLGQLDAIDVGDPGDEDPQAVLDQLQQAIDAFEAAAAVAPPDVAGDIQAIADGLSEIRDIVAVIVDQQGLPTPQQQEQLAAIEDSIQPAAAAPDAWVEANCASPATAVRADPTFTG